ncbi:MAG: diacylglycerol kinase [Pseudomonadota bacterium]
MANHEQGLARIIKAAGYSWAGIKTAWINEAAFRQEAWLAVALIPLGAWLGKNGIERALLIACVVLVLVVELLNSAVEATIDRIGAERHPLSGRAKDFGSAAVLLSLINVAVVWALILGA